MQQKTNKFTKRNNGVYRMSKKAVIIGCTSILAVLCVLLTIAGIFDYQIDGLLAKGELPKPQDSGVKPADGSTLGQVYTNDIIGKFVEIAGNTPIIVCTIVALMIFHQNAYKIKNNYLKGTTQISCVLVGIMGTIYISFFVFFPTMVTSVVGADKYAAISPLYGNGHVKNANTVGLYLVLGAFLGGMFITPTYFGLRRVDKQLMSELLRYAFIFSAAGVFCILVTEITIKPMLQRERFRFLMAYGNVDMNDAGHVPTGALADCKKTNGYYLVTDGPGMYSSYGGDTSHNNMDPCGGYHSWGALPYTPYGFGSTGNLPFIAEDASKSFPSGHETMAAVGFYSLIILPFTTRKFNTKKYRITFLLIGIIGSGFVAFARILAGAHYLSDVTMGSVIAMSLLLIFFFLYTYGSKHLDRGCNLQIVDRRNA